MASSFTEYPIDFAIIPEQVHEDWTYSPQCIVELSAMVGERGAPAYQVIKSSLTSQETLYRSCIFDSFHFAATEFARHSGWWIPESGRLS